MVMCRLYLAEEDTFPEINEKFPVVRGQAERNAINSPIQGSAADMIKIAMVHSWTIQKKKKKKKSLIRNDPAGTIDELVFDVLKMKKKK